MESFGRGGGGTFLGALPRLETSGPAILRVFRSATGGAYQTVRWRAEELGWPQLGLGALDYLTSRLPVVDRLSMREDEQ